MKMEATLRVRLPADMTRALDRAAARQCVSVSTFTRRVLFARLVAEGLVPAEGIAPAGGERVDHASSDRGQ